MHWYGIFFQLMSQYWYIIVNQDPYFILISRFLKFFKRGNCMNKLENAFLRQQDMSFLGCALLWCKYRVRILKRSDLTNYSKYFSITMDVRVCELFFWLVGWFDVGWLVVRLLYRSSSASYMWRLTCLSSVILPSHLGQLCMK